MRTLFYKISIPLVLGLFILGYFYHWVLWFFIVVGPLFVLGVFDATQKRHTILRNFPVLGHFRYMFEVISPEIQQYFIERNTDGHPFPRNLRSIAYQRAKDVRDTHPFGTELDITTMNYEGLRHSIYPVLGKLQEAPRVTIGNAQCSQPYSASLLNISAMSFGALSKNAVMALNKGAKEGGFYHNTGEGGLSPYHLQGGDVVWQIGTAYFGCRNEDGSFHTEAFQEQAQKPEVKMIEIKLSQGAKPGHGGVLPGVKVSPEIAKIRMLEPWKTVISPPGHTTFSNAIGLLGFVQKLRELSGGKPVGFKLCIGKTEEFLDICEAMVDTKIYPDFITVDGAEGGTGAAPPEFSDAVGVPLEPSLIFVRQSLEKYKLKEHIKIICSGKILSGLSFIKALALGADLCNSARGFMFSLGCIQALRCNTNQCPTGITTQNKMLMKGLVVDEKYKRVANFHRKTLENLMELLAASGKKSIDEIDVNMFIRGDELIELKNRYFPDSVQNRVSE